METSAKYKANRIEIVAGVVSTSILNVNQGNNSLILQKISQNLHLAHFQLLKKISAKYKVNRTETVRVVRTSIFKSNQRQ